VVESIILHLLHVEARPIHGLLLNTNVRSGALRLPPSGNLMVGVPTGSVTNRYGEITAFVDAK
jgi:hypothetical protein